MKTYEQVKKEIEKAKASMIDTAKTEKQLNYENFREAYRNGSPEEVEAARKAYKEAEARYIKECEHNNDIRIKIEILKDNAKQALFNDIIGTICDIWNKYEGKPRGEKTAQKIRDELKAATGYYISIGNKYDDAHIQTYFHYEDKAPFNTLEIMPIWNGEKQPALSDNKIVKLNPEKMKVYCCGEYVENVNAHVKALKKAHAAAKAAEKAFEEAISNYNKLTRGNIQHANTREGVKHYIV